jgi:CRISPR-associated endonuclease Cas2
MKRTGWYLFVYDISDPKRLKKVHSRIKKEGIAVQKSVFFIRGNETKIQQIIKKISKVVDIKTDDLRAYPIRHVEEIWTNHKNPLANYPVKDRFTNLKCSKKSKKKRNKIAKKQISLWQKIFG